MTELRNEYLTDEELEMLIADVEMHGMLECPSYMRQEVLERTRISLKKRKKQYYLYSFKVWAAAAAAIVILFTLPAQPQIPETRLDITEKLSRQTGIVCESLSDFTDMLIDRDRQEEY